MICVLPQNTTSTLTSNHCLIIFASFLSAFLTVSKLSPPCLSSTLSLSSLSSAVASEKVPLIVASSSFIFNATEEKHSALKSSLENIGSIISFGVLSVFLRLLAKLNISLYSQNLLNLTFIHKEAVALFMSKATTSAFFISSDKLSLFVSFSKKAVINFTLSPFY